MSTESTLTRSVLINKHIVPRRRKIIKQFYSETTWKLTSAKELNEKEVNIVIRRINEFYNQFFKEKCNELLSFGFELKFRKKSGEPGDPKEPQKDSPEFILNVTLASYDYIPTESFEPPSIDFPLDQRSPDTVNISDVAAKAIKANNGSKNGNDNGCVTPTLENITVKAYDSAPTQNTGNQGKAPTK